MIPRKTHGHDAGFAVAVSVFAKIEDCKLNFP